MHSLPRLLLSAAGLATLTSLALAQPAATLTPAAPIAKPAAPAAATTAAPTSPLTHEIYKLDNGMTVILHIDNSLPIAGVNLWYRVGARNEPAGRSGFAHLFEHLMFMGTKRVPGSDFDKLMEAGGGSNNASTSLDRTNYFSWGPNHILPLLLWLDADRLEDVGATMTKEKLDLQRDVVRNEIRQNVENAPYARAYEQSYKLMYPDTHPYHKGVYGTHADLEAATANDVKDFFSTFYTPENVSLVVAGNFDPAVVRPMIQSMFGTLPRGNAAPQTTKIQPARLERVIRATMLDKVQLPKVQFMYHSPGSYKPGEAEIQLAGLSLADGKSSRLYQRLVVKEKLAVEVSASPDTAALGSLFRIDVLAVPGADLTRIEAIVDEELAKFTAEGPSQEELDRRKTQIELSTVSSLQSVQRRADLLNEYLYYFGKPDALAEDLARYRSATIAGIKEWAKTVFTPDARVIMRILPDEAAPAETPRQARPADTAKAEFTPPLPIISTLPSGISHIHFERAGVPMISMTVVLKSETPLDTIAQAGRASLLAAMLQEGTTQMDAAALAETLQTLGGTLSASSTIDSIEVSIEGLARNADRLAEVLGKVITSPRMAQADFDRVKGLRINALQQQADEPQVVAPRLAAKMLWADSNPDGASTFGTLATTPKLTLADLQSLYSPLFTPAKATVITVGQIDKPGSQRLTSAAIGTWKPAAAPVTETPAPVGYEPRASTGMSFYIVDRPGAVQTMISFAAPGLPVATPNRVDLELANIILGGSFTSRLNNNLREVHGFTYGARSRVSFNPKLGTMTASTAVKAETTGPALAEFRKELQQIAAGTISDAELTKARETMLNETAQSFATIGGVAGHAVGTVLDGQSFTTLAEDLAKARKATASSLNTAAAGTINLDKGVLVLVGDAKLIQEQIKDLGLPAPTIVDADGKPVK